MGSRGGVTPLRGKGPWVWFVVWAVPETPFALGGGPSLRPRVPRPFSCQGARRGAPAGAADCVGRTGPERGRGDWQEPVRGTGPRARAGGGARPPRVRAVARVVRGSCAGPGPGTPDAPAQAPRALRGAAGAAEAAAGGGAAGGGAGGEGAAVGGGGAGEPRRGGVRARGRRRTRAGGAGAEGGDLRRRGRCSAAAAGATGLPPARAATRRRRRRRRRSRGPARGPGPGPVPRPRAHPAEGTARARGRAVRRRAAGGPPTGPTSRTDLRRGRTDSRPNARRRAPASQTVEEKEETEAATGVPAPERRRSPTSSAAGPGRRR